MKQRNESVSSLYYPLCIASGIALGSVVTCSVLYLRLCRNFRQGQRVTPVAHSEGDDSANAASNCTCTPSDVSAPLQIFAPECTKNVSTRTHAIVFLKLLEGKHHVSNVEQLHYASSSPHQHPSCTESLHKAIKQGLAVTKHRHRFGFRFAKVEHRMRLMLWGREEMTGLAKLAALRRIHRRLYALKLMQKLEAFKKPERGCMNGVLPNTLIRSRLSRVSFPEVEPELSASD